ncbi:MAG TPA: rhomboid family intramembrane serine protease [Chlamydiales bacterium]|nr:rhomboid family intramembrane serine protease [Chlamydiales bacterium]
MRLIGTLSNESYARRIATYLKQKGIDSNCEVSFDTQTGQMAYHLWVLDEDKIEAASVDFVRFQKEPANVEFDAPVALRLEGMEGEASKEEEPRIQAASWKNTPFTVVILAVCSAIFLFNGLQELPLLQSGLQNVFLMTPIQAALLYDVPAPIEALEKMIQKRETQQEGGTANLSAEVEQRLNAIEKTPYWRGVYDWLILKFKGQDTSLASGPLFSRISQGEIWRLFSPALLHSQFFHILFNMIWLWILGRPIEQRIGIFKTAALTLVSGVGSNTIQYLVSGPFFIGYSGVVMALAGFIWMRERVAPWEGYPLNRTTIFFLALFIGIMLVFSLVSFFLQLFASDRFAFDIANTAHITGAIIGALVGRFSYFAQKVIKK